MASNPTMPSFENELEELQYSALVAEKHHITVVILFGLVFYPLFGVLDFIVYPDQLFSLLFIRATVVVWLAIMLPVIWRAKTVNRVIGMISMGFFVSGIGIVAMVWVTEGASSPYYAGICLVFMATSVLISWPVFVSILVYSTIILGYGIAIWTNPTPFELRPLANNLFFLLSTAGIGVIGTLVRYNLTQREFAARLALAQQAQLDPLTGLRNRRGLAEKLSEVLSIHKRFEIPSTVALIDLDNFKQVNDTLGHSAGDELLKRVAQVLKQQTRETDQVYRIGGDEFLILYQNVNKESCLLGLKRVHSVITALTREKQYAKLNVGLSTGIVEVCYQPETMETGTHILEAADSQLYQAKRSGKGRMVG